MEVIPFNIFHKTSWIILDLLKDVEGLLKIVYKQSSQCSDKDIRLQMNNFSVVVYLVWG